MIFIRTVTRTIAFFLLSVSFAGAQPAIISQKDIFSPVRSRQGMVVSTDSVATQIGVEVLKKGGNAIDAAVTIGFVMAVTQPRAGNIGGGGFMLIHRAKSGEVVAIDYREKAPSQAHRNMFLDKKGTVNTALSRLSHLSAGVPGTVAGLALVLEKYGTLTLKEALSPSIRLAEEGFAISSDLSNAIKIQAVRLKQWASTRKVFFKPDGSFYEPGDRFIQRDLAKTLQTIAGKGINAFYQGEIADLIVKEMEAHNGLITKKDLSNYRAVVRKPVHGIYRDFDIYSMSPPSSGGVHIVQILNILEGYDIGSLGHNSAVTIHLMTEAMKRAYADRSHYLGDPDFVTVPVKGLTSKKYALQLRNQIDRSQTSVSQNILPGKPDYYESDETTHFSVVDKAGNVVSNTYTVNFSFGSGIVVEGAGFLLNNEMDDFSAKPGVPNAYGLIGGAANAIEPEKRMLSSMSPTIVLKDGGPFLATGSPGGSRIITTTLQVIMNVVDHGMNIQEAVNAPRIHHQWLPDETRIEEGISPDTIKLLEAMGHTVSVQSTMGAASSILIDNEKGVYYGASDPRRSGLALGY
jgi:gamma-glutamyltranspeptidase/glutathione hydrolase